MGRVLDSEEEDENPVVIETKSENPLKKTPPILKKSKNLIAFQTEIQSLENQKTELSEQLNSGITDHQKLQDLASQIKQIGDTLDAKTMR